MTVDMGVPADCQAAWQRILADMGPIDIVINNVGNREVSVPIASESLETWQKSSI
jgi:gluconate 5-dehydrogenase